MVDGTAAADPSTSVAQLAVAAPGAVGWSSGEFVVTTPVAVAVGGCAVALGLVATDADVVEHFVRGACFAAVNAVVGDFDPAA